MEVLWSITYFLVLAFTLHGHVIADAKSLVGSGHVGDGTQAPEIEGTLMVNCSGVRGINFSFSKCTGLGDVGVNQGVCILTEGGQYLPCPCNPLMIKKSRSNQRCAGMCPAMHSQCREETIFPTTATPITTSTTTTPSSTTDATTTTSDHGPISSTADVKEKTDKKFWIAVVACSILLVIALVIGIGTYYYRRYKKCPLPCHNCTTNCPLFKLIKCFCKDYLEARREENPGNELDEDENLQIGQPVEEDFEV